jgi:hypothetical protein
MTARIRRSLSGTPTTRPSRVLDCAEASAGGTIEITRKHKRVTHPKDRRTTQQFLLGSYRLSHSEPVDVVTKDAR